MNQSGYNGEEMIARILKAIASSHPQVGYCQVTHSPILF